MGTRNRGREAFRKWRDKTGQTLSEVEKAIQDPGGQLSKWASSARKSMPLHLKVKLSHHTGIPLDLFLDDRERETARGLVAAFARDAAA